MPNDTPAAAQLASEAWVRRTEGRDETAAALRAFAVWYLHTYPTASSSALSAWHLLATYPEGQADQAMWHAIAQAVLAKGA